jgi:hypothetical protein
VSKLVICFKTKDTDAFKIPVRETDVMEVIETLGGTVQLLLHVVKERSRISEVPYQVQSISVVIPDVFHDVSV